MTSKLLSNSYVDINARVHGGNKQSNEANKRVAPFKASVRERILEIMRARDARGLGTSRRHAADILGKEAGQISGRFTELKVTGEIQETGRTEDGFMVYRLAGSPRVKLETTVPGSEKLLYVKGPGFTCGATFQQIDGRWVMTDCAPYLRAVIRGAPVKDIGNLLKAKGFTYEWVKEKTND